jgi:hypothetical protein
MERPGESEKPRGALEAPDRLSPLSIAEMMIALRRQ